VRWWPLILIAVAVAGWLAWVGISPEIHRQDRVMKTIAGGLSGIVLVLLWLVALSRLPWRHRLGGVLLVAVLLGLAAALFRIDGVTGDLLPRLVPRWARGSTQTVAPANAPEVELPSGFPGFPQFLGPSRDGIIPGPALARDWKSPAPELLWRVPVGESYAGIAIAGARAISIEQRGANETVVCRNLFTGATLWMHEDAARYENPLGGIGPRAMPTIAGERVFAVGATGHLRCLSLADGSLQWQRDLLRDASATLPEWGVAGSPLIVGDVVVVHPGGNGHSLAAYQIATGEPAWAGGEARAGYSSPQFVTLLGEPQFLIFNHDGVAGHGATDGRVLWSYAWTKAAQHVTDPRAVGPDRFVVSAGYGSGADLVTLSRDAEGAWQTTRVWHTQRLKSKFASVVVRDGFLYGLDDGRLTCIDLATGQPRWTGERIGHGQLLLAGDLLVATAENGDIILLEAVPDVARELGRFSALRGKMWNPPALAPPFLLVRNQTEAACYRLPLAQPEAGKSAP